MSIPRDFLLIEISEAASVVELAEGGKEKSRAIPASVASAMNGTMKISMPSEIWYSSFCGLDGSSNDRRGRS